MTEETIWQQVGLARHRALAEVEDVSEGAADRIPEGFHNNIRWNLGHILVVQERLMSGSMGESLQVPPHYEEWFSPGTKPADWTGEVPSLSELKRVLSEHTARLQDHFANRLEEKTQKPFKPGDMEFHIVGDMLRFSLYHEGLHTGFIKGLKRAIGL